MGDATSQRSNVDQWLSEYPHMRKVILDPNRVMVFAANPPPRKDSDEWSELVRQIDPSGEFARSTGSPPSPSSTDHPPEPPF